MLSVPDYSKATVVVIGDVMLDRYFAGPALRISPEAPVPVVRIDHRESRPGGAANVALNIASLGAKAVLIGLTGEDAERDELKSLLEKKGVECRTRKGWTSSRIYSGRPSRAPGRWCSPTTRRARW